MMRTNLLKLNLLILALLFISNGIMAQRAIWAPGGDENGAGIWEDAANWSTGEIPGTTTDSRAIFRGGECFVDTDVTGTFRVELGDNKSDNRAVLTVEAGGFVGAHRIGFGHSEVGVWSPAKLIVEEGGTFSTGTSHFWIGSTKSYSIVIDGVTSENPDANMGSEVHINGGTIIVGGMFGIDFYNDKEYSGGTLFMNGGLLDLAQWNPGNPDEENANASLGKNGKIEYTDGLIRIKGDYKASLERFRDNGQITGEFEIWVEDIDGVTFTKLSRVEVTGITVTATDDATTITTSGGTLQMLATVIPENATDKSITWSVNDEAIAAIDADGLLTAVSNGDVTVTATANDGSGVTGELVITVALPGTTVWNPAANDPSDGLWTTGANWTNGLPHKDSKVVFNVTDAIDCIVDADVSGSYHLVQGDGGPGGVLHIKDGGVVATRTDGWSAIGWNHPATLIVDEGGEITFGQHMWIAHNAGADNVEIHLNGGIITIESQFGMDWNGAGNVSTLYLNDGLLNLANIHPTQSMGANSKIIIDEGLMQIANNHEGVMQAYIDAGKIIGKDGAEIEILVEEINGVTFTKLSKADDILVTEITVEGEDGATTITEIGGTLQMIATVLPENASDATVTWSVNDEDIAIIDTDGLLTAKTDGVVTVTATANDGSGITGMLDVTITNQGTSVWESAATSQIINIYPNPVTTDILYLQNAANAEVEIYSITGQIIIARSNTSQINIQNLEPGIYFVRINAEGTQQTRKLIRE